MLSLIVLVLFCSVGLSISEKPTSIYGIGGRVEGDHLLVKDHLQSPTKSIEPRNHTIKFQYPIPDKVISFIELSTNSNVFAEFTLTVNENIKGQNLIGSVTANLAKDFYLNLSVFGFENSEMPIGFKSILHPELDFLGVMVPNEERYEDDNDYYDDGMDEDTLLILGARQPGDALIYQTEQYSTLSDIRSNHSVQFYYIDSKFITFAQFTPFQTNTANAIYSHVTEHALNVLIYDNDCFQLKVKFELYGYNLEDKPINYLPPWPQIYNEQITPVNRNSLTVDRNKLANIEKLIPPPTHHSPSPSPAVGCLCNEANRLTDFLYLFPLIIGSIFIAFL